MNTAPAPQETTRDPRDPNYAAMSDRDLCVALSANDKIKRESMAALREIERDAVAAREAGKPFERGGELEDNRTKLFHSVRQVLRIKEEQTKRAKSNHVHRAIKRGKAKRR